MSDHDECDECVVKLTNGKLAWYIPVLDVRVLDNGDLFIDHAAYKYIIPVGDWQDYKVRKYDPETTFDW